MPDNNENTGQLRRIVAGVSNFAEEAKDTEAMTDVQTAVYWRMKLKYMERRGLPNDIPALKCMFARDKAGQKAVEWLVSSRFTVDGAVLRHAAWDRTIAIADKNYASYSERGKKGAEKRHGKGSSATSSATSSANDCANGSAIAAAIASSHSIKEIKERTDIKDNKDNKGLKIGTTDIAIGVVNAPSPVGNLASMGTEEQKEIVVKDVPALPEQGRGYTGIKESETLSSVSQPKPLTASSSEPRSGSASLRDASSSSTPIGGASLNSPRKPAAAPDDWIKRDADEQRALNLELLRRIEAQEREQAYQSRDRGRNRNAEIGSD